ncbi:hypothetical protein D3C76_1133140 [compost metagenome]
MPMRSGCELSMLSVLPLSAVLSKLTIERNTVGCPGTVGNICEVSTLPCSRVPTGICAVSMRVRVATLAAMACCTVTARLPAEGWVTAMLVPWDRGWLLKAWSVVCRPLSRVSLSSN